MDIILLQVESAEVEQSLIVVESGRKWVGSAYFVKHLPQYNNMQYNIFLAMEKQGSVWSTLVQRYWSKSLSICHCLLSWAVKFPPPNLNLPLSLIQASVQHIYFVHRFIPVIASDNQYMLRFEEVIFLFVKSFSMKLALNPLAIATP